VGADIYAQPADGELQRRRWDPEGSYNETYPCRVPPQWIAFGYPPPPLDIVRPERWTQWVMLLALLLVALWQLLGAYLFVARYTWRV
jgi:hypothetical protein